MSRDTDHSRLRFGRFIGFVAMFVCVATLIGCGSSDQVPVDGTGPYRTDPLTSEVTTELDTFAKNMFNLLYESNKYQGDVRNSQDYSASKALEVLAKFQQFTDRWRVYCVDAQQGLASSSGDQKSVWQAGSDWCMATVAMWSGVTEGASIAANGGPPFDATNPDNIALFKKSVQLGENFGRAYCGWGGVIC